MRASEVLQKCLPKAWAQIHAARTRVLLKAVDALAGGQRLTLFDLARAWPNAERMRSALKAADRLLSNPHLIEDGDLLARQWVRWLVPGTMPIILVDWSDLKEDRSWCLLRAAVPVGGRTVTLLDEVHPGEQLGSPVVQRRFLHHLARLLPPGTRPILVTDAGFRTPWLREVEALGWYYVCRLRGNTRVKPVEERDVPEHWVDCRRLYPLANHRPRELALMQSSRGAPITTRAIVWKKHRRGRKCWTRTLPRREVRSSAHQKSAAREREPWLLLASPDLPLSARAIVGVYKRRMQIELAFRDLKSHHYGYAFEDNQTRKGHRLKALLLINTLTILATWLIGLAAEATGLADLFQPRKSKRKLYSSLRVGRRALTLRWRLRPIRRWLERLRCLPEHVHDQMLAS